MNRFIISIKYIFLVTIICVLASGCISFLQKQYYFEPYYNYASKGKSPQDFLHFAEIEFDTLKKIGPQDSSGDMQDSIFSCKQSLIKELLNNVEQSKDTNLMIQSNIFRARSEIAYAERYHRIDHKMTKKEIGKALRNGYQVNSHCDTAIRYLTTNISKFNDTPSVSLLIELRIIQAEIYEKNFLFMISFADSFSQLSREHVDEPPPIQLIMFNSLDHAIPLVENTLKLFSLYRYKNEDAFVKGEKKLNQLKNMFNNPEECWKKARALLK